MCGSGQCALVVSHSRRFNTQVDCVARVSGLACFSISSFFLSICTVQSTVTSPLEAEREATRRDGRRDTGEPWDGSRVECHSAESGELTRRELSRECRVTGREQRWNQRSTACLATGEGRTTWRGFVRTERLHENGVTSGKINLALARSQVL